MTKTASASERELVKLGLSRGEAAAYLALLNTGPQEIRTLSRTLSVLPQALYRTVRSLKTKGLVTATGSHPTVVRALSPALALDAYARQRQTEFEQTRQTLISSLTAPAADRTRIDVLEDASGLFAEYTKLAAEAKQEILIISIGEEVPDDVALANRDALERGIPIRFIVHTSDAANRSILSRWLKMGMEVRHYPDWGFHMVIVDRTASILSVNNPDRTDERTSLVFRSPGLSKAFAEYFDSVWAKAAPVV